MLTSYLGVRITGTLGDINPLNTVPKRSLLSEPQVGLRRVPLLEVSLILDFYDLLRNKHSKLDPQRLKTFLVRYLWGKLKNISFGITSALNR